MRLQIVGGPRDGDYQLIGDRSEDREVGRTYLIGGQKYEITMDKGKPPRLTWRAP